MWGQAGMVEETRMDKIKNISMQNSVADNAFPRIDKEGCHCVAMAFTPERPKLHHPGFIACYLGLFNAVGVYQDLAYSGLIHIEPEKRHCGDPKATTSSIATQS